MHLRKLSSIRRPTMHSSSIIIALFIACTLTCMQGFALPTTPDASELVPETSEHIHTPELAFDQLFNDLRAAIPNCHDGKQDRHCESQKATASNIENIANTISLLTADPAEHSQAAQASTTSDAASKLTSLLKKYLDDLVKHNQHDQSHITYKFGLLKNQVSADKTRGEADVLKAKKEWCEKDRDLIKAKRKMKDVYKYLVAIHKRFGEHAKIIGPVRPPENGLPLPDSDIEAVQEEISALIARKPIYEKRARAYQDNRATYTLAKEAHAGARVAWAAELESEVTTVRGNCTSSTREYEDAVREVKRNVRTRHKSYISVSKLKCFVKHLGEPDAGARCASRKHSASSWKEHQDINYPAWPRCDKKPALAAEFGPRGWKPTAATCSDLESEESESTTPSTFWGEDGCTTEDQWGTKKDHGAKCLAADSDTAAVRCCSENGDKCYSKGAGQCFGKAKTFAEASSICKSNGHRLCTRTELSSQMCCRTGCMYDHERTWTSTGCTSGA